MTKLVWRVSIFLLVFISDSLSAQNFRKIYHEKYNYSINFLGENNDVIQQILSRYNVNYEDIIPIVFPELLRFSMYKDFLETMALELIYINYGVEEANFSIGLFQMKPSFIEGLEQQLIQYPELKNKYANIFIADTTTKEIRKYRISKLRTLEGQLTYACCFYNWFTTKHPEVLKLDYAKKYKLLATAYNHNMLASIDVLSVWSEKKYYPYGVNTERNKYSYADVGLYFYNKDCKKISSR